MPILLAMVMMVCKGGIVLGGGISGEGCDVVKLG